MSTLSDSEAWRLDTALSDWRLTVGRRLGWFAGPEVTREHSEAVARHGAIVWAPHHPCRTVDLSPVVYSGE